MREKAVAYLDLLGFKDTVQNNIDGAILQLTEFNTVLDSKLIDKNAYPSSSYPASLESIARRTSLESVDYFMPFPDSIFATSEDPSQFVLQVGRFVYESFMIEANNYAHPENLSDPTAVKELNIGFYNGLCKSEYITGHHPPILFRGGLSFGEVISLTPSSIVGGIKRKAYTLAGRAVAEAVRYELGLKGPRVSFGENLWNKLDYTAKKYCRVVPEDITRYEILWPALAFITENNENGLYQQEISCFHRLFTSVYNLWIPYRKQDDEKIVEHYRKFIELIIVSTLQVYDVFFGDRQYAVEKIKDALRKKDLASEFGYTVE